MLISMKSRNMNKKFTFDFCKMLLEIVDDMAREGDVIEISTAFHETIVRAFVNGMNGLNHNFHNITNKLFYLEEASIIDI